MIEFNVERKLPSAYDKEQIEMLIRAVGEDVWTNGYTIDNELNLVKVECCVQNNSSWDYHNNYDDSGLVIRCKGDNINSYFVEPWYFTDRGIYRWWSTNYSQARELQEKLLKEYYALLVEEAERVKGMWL